MSLFCARIYNTMRPQVEWFIHIYIYIYRLFYCHGLNVCISTVKLTRYLSHTHTRARGSILHGLNPLSYFSFQPVLHDWCNKGRGMFYPVCGMVHIKGSLLLRDKSSLCGGSGFPFSLSEWSLTICMTPYNGR